MTSYLAWWDLYDKTADEFRGLVCRQAIYLHTVTLFVTHIRPDQADYQISQTRDHLQVVVASNIATLVGGDFNVVAYSDSLNRIYNSAFLYGYGQFGEVDQYCGGSNRTKPLGRGAGRILMGSGRSTSRLTMVTGLTRAPLSLEVGDRITMCYMGRYS